MANVPQPITNTDAYLAAILEELRRIREKLDPPQPLQGQPPEQEVGISDVLLTEIFGEKPPKKGKR